MTENDKNYVATSGSKVVAFGRTKGDAKDVAQRRGYPCVSVISYHEAKAKGLLLSNSVSNSNRKGKNKGFVNNSWKKRKR